MSYCILHSSLDMLTPKNISRLDRRLETLPQFERPAIAPLRFPKTVMRLNRSLHRTPTTTSTTTTTTATNTTTTPTKNYNANVSHSPIKRLILRGPAPPGDSSSSPSPPKQHSLSKSKKSTPKRRIQRLILKGPSPVSRPKAKGAYMFPVTFTTDLALSNLVVAWMAEMVHAEG